MKALPKLIKGRYTLTQIWREGNVAIYEQTKDGSERQWYEVILVQKHKGFTIKGQKFPPAEFYPSSEQWGTKGWSFLTLAEAKKKAYSLAP